MVNNIIGQDITLNRKRYDEALKLQGIPAKYQFPNLAETNNQGETLVDSYSDYIDTHIFFESNPKLKTIKRYGWVVENNSDLPFLIHCSWNLPHLQKDALFTFSGLYAELGDRLFRVTELSYDVQAPDHIVAQVIPVYDKQHIAGRTPQEVKKEFNKSNKFLKPQTDYRGNSYYTKADLED